MENLIRDSHYIPRALLRNWSEDGKNVFGYRLLVSHPKVPEWQRCSIKWIAYQRDLYTTIESGQEADCFENWMAKKYEEPGLKAIEKVLKGTRLTRSDKRDLARLVAAQDVRTPLAYIEMMKHAAGFVPEVLGRCLEETIAKVQEANEKGIRIEPKGKSDPYSREVRLTYEPVTDGTSDKIAVRASVTLGRRWWIIGMQHLLSRSGVLCQHHWSILTPYGDEEWPLTDHPVLRLNYSGKDDYTFGGGWAFRGSEILMPLSPRHLLYAQVGKRPMTGVLPREITKEIQRFFVERAFRWIFARQPLPWVAKLRPRMVDAVIFKEEAQAWNGWNKSQLEAER
jgi:hypothetical protein